MDARGLADVDAVFARARLAWKPPPKLSLSQWMDAEFVLSPETAAEPGKWKTLPYQKGIADAITDPAVTDVSVMKSARVGYTLLISGAIGYYIHQDPCGILVVQPTVDDAKSFSKETVAPMMRDVPVLRSVVLVDEERGRGPKDSSNTLTHKKYPGGVLSLTGANSGTGFRRISRRIVLLDEVDAYPPSAGSEGDPVKLAKMRSFAFWNRKVIAGSTPLVAGASRIAELFEAGDQRRYHVPCPTCGHMDFLTFREGDRGHWMHWPEGKPEEAHFICRGCGCEILHKDKRAIIEAGEWRADKPFAGHASFHLWAALSYAPNASWGQIAAEFLESKRGGSEKLRTFVNTWLGETWTERGEAPDWMRLYQRREHYEKGTVPAPVVLLTAGVDVQKDRLVYEVVGWGADRQSWSIDAGVLPGDTAGEEVWRGLDELLTRSWPTEKGGQIQIQTLGVDSGFNTQFVYNWARNYPGRVLACKGISTGKVLLSSPTPVDVTIRGKRIARGCKVWPVGVDIAKHELYGWLRLDPPKDGEPFPPGFCHFPEYGDDFFKQLTAEQLVPVRKRTGFVSFEWQVVAGRENHYLDARVYARAATVPAGLDRYAAAKRQAASVLAPKPEPSAPTAEAVAPPERPPSPAIPRVGSWLGGGRMRPRGGWLR